MKNILPFSFLMLICFVGKAQRIDRSVIYMAKYNCSVKTDTFAFSERYVLTFNTRESLFQSFDKIEGDSIREVQMQQEGESVIRYKKSTSDYKIYNNYKDNTFLESRVLLQPYAWSVPKENYNWKITSDTATIAGLKCIKAIGYPPSLKQYITAWYAKDIPISTGPSRVTGLPGLIVKVLSRDKRINYELYSFSLVPKNSKLAHTKLPRETLLTSKEKFDAMVAAAKKDPTGFLLNSGVLPAGTKRSDIKITK